MTRRLADPAPVDVGAVEDVPVGLSEVAAGRRRVLLVRGGDGRIFAVADRCPHRGAPLRCGTAGATWAPAPPGELSLDEARLVVRCPWHGWEFDPATGEAVHGVSDRRLLTFPVEIRDGRVLVTVQRPGGHPARA